MRELDKNSRCSQKNEIPCRKRGRTQLRWDDCLKTDLKKGDGEEKWRKPTTGSDGKNQVAVKQGDEWPTSTLQ